MTPEQSDFSEFLTDRDRILMAAWMLPNEGELTESQRLQALNNFVEYCARVGMNYEKVAKQVGKPTTGTIYDLLKQNWNENTDKHIRVLNNWVEQHARSQAVKLKGRLVVDTKVALDIQRVAEMIRTNGTMGVIYGATGIGKTRCAQAVYDTVSGSIFLTITNVTGSAASFRHLLFRAVGGRMIRKPGPMPVYLFDTTVQILKDSNRLIIIDEAHKLRDDAIEYLREVHDHTGCPVLCLATKELYDRIQSNATPDAGQIKSRFDISRPLTQGVGSDGANKGKRLFTVEDIRKLYEITPIRLNKDAANYLVDVANLLGHGSLRRCGMLVANAARRARKRMGVEDGGDVVITADDLAYVESKLSPEPTQTAEAAERRTRAVAAG